MQREKFSARGFGLHLQVITSVLVPCNCRSRIYWGRILCLVGLANVWISDIVKLFLAYLVVVAGFDWGRMLRLVGLANVWFSDIRVVVAALG